MGKKFLYVRTGPYDLNLNSYNVQEIGLAKAFCMQGYNIDIIIFKTKDQKQWTLLEHNGCKVQCIELPRFRWFRWGINLNLCKKEFLSQYDYVISSEYMQLQTYLLSKKVKNMYIYNGPYYNLFMFKWSSFIYDFLFTKEINQRVKHIFTKSILAEQYLRHKGYENITTVGVGLDIERFKNEEPINPTTQQLINYMKQHKCILYVGALSERKNFPFMLEVYKKVLEYDSNIKFVMIGKSVINPYAKLIGKKDEDYENSFLTKLPPKIKEGIYRLNKIENSQLKYIYPLAKAFLLPSKQEIFGMVLLEAMYLGAPVISSKNGGSMTLIHNKNTGQIINKFDAKEWSNAIIKYITDNNYTKQTVIRAYNLIKDEYNWNVITQKMLKKMN